MIAKVKQFILVSKRDLLVAVLPAVALGLLALAAVYYLVDPAPPDHIVISTGEKDSDYETFGRLYADILKQDGVRLELRPSAGALRPGAKPAPLYDLALIAPVQSQRFARP